MLESVAEAPVVSAVSTTVEKPTSRPRAVFPVLAGLMVCWALATPLFGVPDEPTQVVKAAAVARGELIGTTLSGPYTGVRVPASLVGTRYGCFVFQPLAPASCQPAAGGGTRVVDASTYVGRYPPLYYALVGWPSLFTDGDLAIYLMRIMTALLAAFFVAGAFRSAAASSRARWLLVALAAVVTPYVLYFGGTVNASGLEMATAICAWTTGLVLFGEPRLRRDRRLLVRFTLALGTLVEVRGLGLFFGAVVVVVLLGLFGYRRLMEPFGDRTGRLAAALVGVSAAFSGAWIVFVGGLALLGGQRVAANSSVGAIVSLSLHRFGQDLVEMVGMFGWWNSTYLSRGAYLIWFTVALAGVLIGLAFARGRRCAVAAALVVFSVGFPVVLVSSLGGGMGIVGQGRYWLPLVAGAILVTACVTRPPSPRGVTAASAVVSLLLLGVQIFAFPYVLDRYRFGVGAPRVGSPWSPPGGALLLVVVYVALALLLARWWWNAAFPPRGRRGRRATVKLGGAVLVTATALPLAAPSVVAGAVTTYSWRGTDADSGGSRTWSDAGNWQGGRSPSGSNGDDLVFPAPSRCGGRAEGYCVVDDDLATNAAYGLTIGGGSYWMTSSTGALALGGGGLRVDSSRSSARTRIGIPLTLSANQIWHLGPGTTLLEAPIGGYQALTADLAPGATASFFANVDIGWTNVIGPAGARRGAAVVLHGNDLDAASGSPLALVDVALRGDGSLGPVVATGVPITVGQGPTHRGRDAGVVRVIGDMSLDDTSSVTFDDLRGAGGTGDGHPELFVTGNLTLSEPALHLEASCDTAPGATFVVVKAHSLAGSFTDADGRIIADGDVVAGRAVGGGCRPYFRVTYGAGAVTATAVAGPGG